MSALDNIFKGYCAQMSRLLREEKHGAPEQLDLFGQKVAGDLAAEKLHHVLEARTFDGTEAHRVIDCALPGLENAAAAATIKHAIQAQYSYSIPIDTAVELVMTFLKNEEQNFRA